MDRPDISEDICTEKTWATRWPIWSSHRRLCLPESVVMEALYEASNGAGRHGHSGAMTLMIDQGAKGLEFGLVIVVDCADCSWTGEDEQ